MQIITYLLAFGEDIPIPERKIDVPFERVPGGWDQDENCREELLEAVFYYGQNDFQPRPIRSLSCGDVVKLPDNSLHRVRGVGWEHLPPDTDIGTLPRGVRAAFC